MKIEEVVRSCAHEAVAATVVRCIGRAFHADIEAVARAFHMTPGAFTALAVQRFARHDDEAEKRAVRAAMQDAQEPILMGLHRILCIMLAAAVPFDGAATIEYPGSVHPGEVDRAEICRGGRWGC